MRYIRSIAVMVLACVIAAGCSSSKRTSRRRLAKQIDLARRLYNHATALLANPQYIDRTTGQRSPIPHKLQERDIDVPTTRPINNPQAETKLDEARKILTDALPANPDAPAGTKADAHHLLGEIQLARGKYHCTSAERLRNKAADLRSYAHTLLELAGSNMVLAQFGHKLANLPRAKIEEMRDKTAKQLAALDTDITAIDRKITSLETDNSNLSKANEQLLAEARSLRDRGDATRGAEGLEMHKKAKNLNSDANKNSSKIAANQQMAETLKSDRGRLQQKRGDTNLKLTMVKKHLEAMDERSKDAMNTEEDARQRASENCNKAKELIGRIVKCCEDLTEQENLAAAVLGKDEALKHLGEAEKAVRAEIAAAKKVAMKQQGRPNEITEGLSNDQHLVLIIAMKGSASLALGDLRTRQIATAKANAALADSAANLWKQLDQETPPVVQSLKAYLPDAGKTRTLAEEDYKSAEASLEKILKSHMKGRLAQNTAWICQAQLAGAYLGHFRLTGDRTVLDKAKQFVAEALADKTGSPYLKPVVELQRLIQTAGQ